MDPFSAIMVPVDATAEDANLARANALVDGYSAGLEQVFRRLVLEADYDHLPALSDTRISQMISGFEILDERVSTGRYRANLNLNFKPGEVRLELRNADVRFAESVSRPVVVLPVLVVGNAPRLWQGPNPWWDAWTQRVSRGELVPLILPLGDEADSQSMEVDQALAGELGAFAQIIARYDAREALVATALASYDPLTKVPTLDITLISSGTLDRVESFRLSGTVEADGWVSVFASAVDTITRWVDDEWKLANLLHFDHEETLEVALSVSALDDWLMVRDRLEAVSLVQQVDLLELSTAHVRIRLRYLGESEGIAFALRQADLDLEETPDGWTLRSVDADKLPAVP